MYVCVGVYIYINMKNFVNKIIYIYDLDIYMCIYDLYIYIYDCIYNVRLKNFSFHEAWSETFS